MKGIILSLCGRKNSILTENVRSYLEVEKLNQPSIYSYELQKIKIIAGRCLFTSRDSIAIFHNQVPS